MGCGRPSSVANQEETFANNSVAVNQLLLNSQSGKSAEYWRAQMFSILSVEDIKARGDQKVEMFKNGNKHIKDAHRSAAN